MREQFSETNKRRISRAEGWCYRGFICCYSFACLQVCHYHLVAFCPHDLFPNTKSDPARVQYVCFQISLQLINTTWGSNVFGESEAAAALLAGELYLGDLSGHGWLWCVHKAQKSMWPLDRYMARRYEVGYGECKDLSRPGATKLQRDFHIPWQLKNGTCLHIKPEVFK